LFVSAFTALNLFCVAFIVVNCFFFIIAFIAFDCFFLVF